MRLRVFLAVGERLVGIENHAVSEYLLSACSLRYELEIGNGIQSRHLPSTRTSGEWEGTNVRPKRCSGEMNQKESHDNPTFGRGESNPLRRNINSLFDEVRYTTPDLHDYAGKLFV
jgi:hypothetical protein